ncbi:GyrI-like domain-containing protein [Roseibium sp.]|uniref:GyrI-like domain-containing protein n=1 Tax=Roseibium sp. TaxID=1936156 RepID=UPI003BA95FC6
MPDFKTMNVEETPYLFQEATCSMDPADIGTTMGQTFQSVWAFMQKNGIETSGKVLAVYYTYNPETMTFRAGFSVSPDAENKAEAPIQFDRTPAGKVVYFQHKGSYSTLRDSYGDMMSWMEKEGLTMGAPAWEVYLNDPATTPEDALLTDVYVSLS